MAAKMKEMREKGESRARRNEILTSRKEMRTDHIQRIAGNKNDHGRYLTIDSNEGGRY